MGGELGVPYTARPGGLLGFAAMDTVRHLVVGAGISGLAACAFSKERDYLVLERDLEIGGYCKTVKQAGFTWDYSGHFFHFKHREIEQWLRDRMPGQDVRVVEKKTFIAFEGGRVDFPFQKNIHQLPQAEFIECLANNFPRLLWVAGPVFVINRQLLVSLIALTRIS